MKTILTAVAAMFLLAACENTAGGCDDCEKMAREANAAHKAEMHKDCECCDKH